MHTAVSGPSVLPSILARQTALQKPQPCLVAVKRYGERRGPGQAWAEWYDHTDQLPTHDRPVVVFAHMALEMAQPILIPESNLPCFDVCLNFIPVFTLPNPESFDGQQASLVAFLGFVFPSSHGVFLEGTGCKILTCLSMTVRIAQYCQRPF